MPSQLGRSMMWQDEEDIQALVYETSIWVALVWYYAHNIEDRVTVFASEEHEAVLPAGWVLS